MLKRLRPFWMFAVAMPALLLGVFHTSLFFIGNLGGRTIFFPAYLLFWAKINVGAIVIVVAGVVLLVAWLAQLVQRQRAAAWNWLAVLIAFAGVPFAFAAFPPHMAGADAPMSSARLGGYVYQLTAHVGSVGFGQFELYKCDALSLFCQPYHIPKIAVGPYTHEGQLIADEAAHTLTIKVNGITEASFRV